MHLILGQLSVGNLDYELHNSYKLEIVASDGKYEAPATVTVLVADSSDPPTFDKSAFAATVNEGEKGGTLVKSLDISSSASGSHTCAWGFDVTPTILKLFTLVAQPKACDVVVADGASIVWTEAEPKYVFDVRAINKANTNEYSETTLTGKTLLKVFMLLSEVFYQDFIFAE